MNLEVAYTFGKDCSSKRFLKDFSIFPKKFLETKTPGSSNKM